MGTIQIDRFFGLNDADSPGTIGDSESPDLLNTESNLQGTALLKRRGFTREAALTVSTAPISGAVAWTCDNGDRAVVVCHNHYCAVSKNDTAFSNFLSTAGGATPPVRWQFVAIDGDIIGVNDRRDPAMVYNCTDDTRPSEMPAGTVLAMTEDRLVVGDTSANPNRVDYSKSGDFDEFTAGSASEDPFTDDLGAPGERTTGLVYDKGILWRFSPQSTTACETGDQYTQRCAIFSPNIGTNDPNSIVVAADGIYFRGSDRAYWRIGSGGLEQISKRIKNYTANQVSGAARNNTQTTETDWNNGSAAPDGSWNTATTAGSIFPSSAVLSDTSANNFSAGTFNGTGVSASGDIGVGAVHRPLSIAYEGTAIPTDDGWAKNLSAGGAASDSVADSTLTVTVTAGNVHYSRALSASTTIHHLITFRARQNAISGAIMIFGFCPGTTGCASAGSSGFDAGIKIDGAANRDILIDGSAIAQTGSGVNGTSFSTYTILITSYSVASFWVNGTFITSGTYAGGLPAYAVMYFQKGNSNSDFFIDSLYYSIDAFDPRGTSDILSPSTFTSRILDTTFVTAIAGAFSATTTVRTGTGVTYQVRDSTSANNDVWDDWIEASDGVRPASISKRYQQYRATFTHSGYLTTSWASDITLPAATTGQFTTQCIQPGTGATSFGTISCNFTTAGAGSVSIAIATATACGDNSVYYAATNNATITNGIGATMKIRLTPLLGSATDQAQVNACTVYWNEGTVAQPVWGVFDSVANSIYWTATTTAATQGDRVAKYDLNLGYFYPFDIRATALLYHSGYVYFGSSTGGFWNKYAGSGIDSDNGAAINAYWKSKDFAGASPFKETSWLKVSQIAKNQVTGNLTTTYTTSNNVAESYTVSLATTSGITYVRSNYNLKFKSPHNFINIKFGNNSQTPFEVVGFMLDYVTSAWRVLGP